MDKKKWKSVERKEQKRVWRGEKSRWEEEEKEEMNCLEEKWNSWLDERGGDEKWMYDKNRMELKIENTREKKEKLQKELTGGG